jgi:hypothetical protein
MAKQLGLGRNRGASVEMMALPEMETQTAPDTATPRKRSGRITNAEKLIGYGSIGSLKMTEAGVDSLLIYGFTAMMAHLLISLGQTLFHRYLGHSRLGGRFFKNHIQFHHVHLAANQRADALLKAKFSVRCLDWCGVLIVQ